MAQYTHSSAVCLVVFKLDSVVSDCSLHGRFIMIIHYALRMSLGEKREAARWQIYGSLCPEFSGVLHR